MLIPIKKFRSALIRVPSFWSHFSNSKVIHRKFGAGRIVGKSYCTVEIDFKGNRKSFVENVLANHITGIEIDDDKLLLDLAIFSKKELQDEKERLLREITQKNHRRSFDLLLFDLDNTLLRTDDLERFRGKENVGNVSDNYIYELKSVIINSNRYLIYEKDLIEINTLYPDLKIGIFTRAPRKYSEILLSQYYSNAKWSVLISYDDTRYTKPNPEGINMACQKLSITDLDRVAVIGDSKEDIESGFRAGCLSVLSRIGFNETNKNNSLSLISDTVINTREEVLKLIETPQIFMPLLESRQVNSKISLDSNVRGYSYFSYSILSENASVKVWFLGRYFPRNGKFRVKANIHKLSNQILENKENSLYPIEWIDSCQHVIKGIARKYAPDPIVVTVIPNKPGSTRGMVNFLGQLMEACIDIPRVEYKSDIFFFSENIKSQHQMSNRAARVNNIKDNLKSNSTVDGRVVVIIDDVVTSGATFFYAERYARDAGASHVINLAIARTISG
jgi:FMN phosphatase YigB (HAD superfamily)/hypoxanthine-guanine phosphoribosyltransferase